MKNDRLTTHVAEATNLGRNHGIFSTYTKDDHALSLIAKHGERPEEAPIAFAEVVRDGGLPHLPEVRCAYIEASAR